MTWELHMEAKFPRSIKSGVCIDLATMQDGGCYIRRNENEPGQYCPATRFVVDECGYLVTRVTF